MKPTETTISRPAGLMWMRRIAPLAMLGGAIAAALFAGSRTQAPAPATVAAVPQSGAASQSGAAHSVLALNEPERPVASHFERSQYSNVMVRHLPAAAQPTGGANARWRLMPGVKRTVTQTGGYGAPVPTTLKSITLANGRGVSRRIPRSSYMAERLNIKGSHLNSQR